MTIETKYDIGQTVWQINRAQALTSDTIRHIAVTITEAGAKVTYGVIGMSDTPEDWLFASPEEAVADSTTNLNKQIEAAYRNLSVIYQ